MPAYSKAYLEEVAGKSVRLCGDYLSGYGYGGFYSKVHEEYNEKIYR